MIPQEIVDRVRESADIVQIIGEHVKLKRAGADFRGPCPFHGGKNPNFSVSPRRAMYHCFKCGETGNVFTFLQKHLGMNFPDAVRAVAATEGIEVPEYTTQREGPDPREAFWEVNATALEFFKKQLWETPGGQEARDYLASRDITRELADAYGLGFAPRDVSLLREQMTALGFDDARLLESGLLVQSEGDVEPRGRFRHRLLFPIFDAGGHPVGFGGRALGAAEPKYLNSPETQVFQKGRTLYALNWTKNDIRKADRVFVVEGYFDAIRLMASGLNTVVAPLGTALTEAQAALLARYTKNVYLLYDSDQAGLKATFRAGDELLRQGMSVRVVTLPGGEDPDTFLRAQGVAALEAHVAQSVDVFERKLQILDRGGWFGELQKKRRALDRLFPTIRATADSLLRDLYVSRTAEKTGIAKEILLREVVTDRRGGVRDAGRNTPPPEPPVWDDEDLPQHSAGGEASPRRVPRRRYRGKGAMAERELIRAMLNDPTRIEGIAERVGSEQFRDPSYRDIFDAMLALSDDFDVERLVDMIAPEDVAEVNELLAEPDAQADPQGTVEASIAQLASREVVERLTEIDQLLPVATEEEKIELTKEKQRLAKDLSGQPAARLFKMWSQPSQRRRS